MSGRWTDEIGVSPIRVPRYPPAPRPACAVVSPRHRAGTHPVTIYDRYLLRSFFWILLVTFVSTFGLFVIIDLMDNFDDFVTNTKEAGKSGLAWSIAFYYGNFAFFFFDAAGRSLCIVSAMTLLILMDRGGELKPLLAAGIPTYRIAAPVVAGAILVNLLHVANREIVIPKIAHHKFDGRGKSEGTPHAVEAAYDHSTQILFDGDQVNLGGHRITLPQILLPAPSLVHELTTIDGPEAIYFADKGGWVVKDADPPYSSMLLTPDGRELVKPIKDSPDVFISGSITPADLYRGTENATMLATPDLIRRIKNPSHSWILARQLVLHFHERMIASAVNVVCVLLVIPLMIRRHSRGMVSNAALCIVVMGGLFGVHHAFSFLGHYNIVSPALSAWGPFIASGTMFAWISDIVQT